jgi:hypothetical protein
MLRSCSSLKELSLLHKLSTLGCWYSVVSKGLQASVGEAAVAAAAADRILRLLVVVVVVVVLLLLLLLSQ